MHVVLMHECMMLRRVVLRRQVSVRMMRRVEVVLMLLLRLLENLIVRHLLIRMRLKRSPTRSAAHVFHAFG